MSNMQLIIKKCSIVDIDIIDPRLTFDMCKHILELQLIDKTVDPQQSYYSSFNNMISSSSIYSYTSKIEDELKNIIDIINQNYNEFVIYRVLRNHNSGSIKIFCKDEIEYKTINKIALTAKLKMQ